MKNLAIQMDPATAAQVCGTVFDIERFSVHDGRGIRTVVFLKGCPLKCGWCANPESNLVRPQIGFFPEKCVNCKMCTQVCPGSELFLTVGQVDWQRCTGCLQCVDQCLYEARIGYGKKMTADEVVKKVVRDKVFYGNSGGGVTLSGGEVTMQPDFAAAILQLCQREGIHTAIETCGFCTWQNMEKALRYVDQLLFDFKCMDPQRHRQYTGVDNDVILANAVRASEMVEEMIVRWPVIPGVNDSDKNAHLLAEFVCGKMPRVKRVDLLPYHSAGKSKCEHIGKEYGYSIPYELTAERTAQLQEILCRAGLDAKVGG